jgi:conflict system pore-forming effector with SLATT domain
MHAGTVDPSATTSSAQGAATDRVLDLVWRRQRQWSRAAGAARARLDRWRRWNLLLLVFGAHLAATQHQRIAATYAATADQLERLIAGIDPATATPRQQAQLVADVERVLAAQNQGWTDLLSPKPTASSKREPPGNP